MPAAVLVEELDEVELRADGDDQLRRPSRAAISIATSWLVPGRRHDLVRQAELAPAARGRGRGRRGRRARRARRRSAASPRRPSPCRRRSCPAGSPASRSASAAAVDADEHRPHVADVRAQRLEVALVVDAAHDDQRRAGRGSRCRSAAARSCRRAGRAPRPCARRCCCANASSASPISGRRWSVACAHGRGLLQLAAREQLAAAQHRRRRAARSGRRRGARSNSSSSGRSTSGMPAWISSSGPMFG